MRAHPIGFWTPVAPCQSGRSRRVGGLTMVAEIDVTSTQPRRCLARAYPKYLIGVLAIVAVLIPEAGCDRGRGREPTVQAAVPAATDVRPGVVLSTDVA